MKPLISYVVNGLQKATMSSQPMSHFSFRTVLSTMAQGSGHAKMHKIMLRVTIYSMTSELGVVYYFCLTEKDSAGGSSEDYYASISCAMSHTVCLQKHPHRRKPLKLHAKAKQLGSVPDIIILYKSSHPIL